MTDPRVLRNRTSLRSALLELLETRPFEQVTIRDIAAASGVGYTTYFRHYPSKEALLGDVAVEEVRALHELTLPVYDAQASRAACLTLCTHVDERRRVWSALLSGAQGFVREEMLRLAREAIAERSPTRLPVDLSAALSVSAMIEVLGWWLRQAEPQDAREVAEILDHVAIAPQAR